MRPWLLRIMHNLYATKAGRDSRQPRGLDDEALQRLGQAAPALPLNFSFDGLDQQIVRAFQQLPGEYQTVLLLWAIDEMSYKEIAIAVDVPIGTVMSRLHRARRQLYDLLREYAIQEGVIRE
jgi:RNA polymerase sigma-70 factor (ECF subfamily)